MRTFLFVFLMICAMHSCAQKKIIPSSDFLMYGRYGIGITHSGYIAANVGMDLILKNRLVFSFSYDRNNAYAREPFPGPLHARYFGPPYPRDRFGATSLRAGYQLNQRRNTIRLRVAAGPALVVIKEANPVNVRANTYCKYCDEYDEPYFYHVRYDKDHAFGLSLETKIEFPFSPVYAKSIGINLLITKQTFVSFTYQTMIGYVRPLRKVILED